MIYAYGVCEPAAAASAPPCGGMGGARVRALGGDGLTAIYSRHRSAPLRPTPRLVLAHERVLEHLMARGPVLPMRFGTWLEGEDALAAMLAARRSELVQGLERVRGRAELGVRLLAARAEAGTGDARASGRAYLLARAREHRRYEQAVADVHAPLAALSAASRVWEPRPPAILVGAYLLDCEHVALFRARASDLAQRQPELQLFVTGPWPPYSFASEEPR